MHGVGIEHEIVEKIAAQQQSGKPYAGIDQHTGGEHGFHQPVRHHAAGGVHAENQGIENHGGGQNRAGLEATAGAEIAMELHIQREQQNEGDQQFPDHPQHQVVLHWPPFSGQPAGAGFLRRRSRAMMPAPAVNTTVVSPSVS